MILKKHLLFIIKWTWIVVVILFVVNYLYNNHQIVFNVIHKIPLLNMILAIIALFAGKIFLVLNMQYSLDYIGKKIQFFKSFHFYNVSQLGKYIPGNIWHFVGRFGYYKTENLTFTEINRALILEILFIISGSLLIGLFFLLLNQELFFYIGNLYWRYQEVINIFLLVVIFIVFFIIVIKKIFLIKIIRKIFINWRLNVKIFLVQLAVWLFLGTSFYLLIQSYITGFDQYTYSIGLYAITIPSGFINFSSLHRINLH